MGLIFALLSAVFYALVFFFSKLLVTKAKYPLVIAGIFQILAGLIFIPLFIIEPMKVYSFDFGIFLLIVLVTIVYSTFNIFSFLSNKLLDFSITGIMAQLTLIITFVGGLIIFKEQPGWLKIIGVSLILLGNISLFFKKGAKKKISFKGVVFRIIASTALGFGILIDAKNSINFSVPFYGFLTYFVSGVITLLYARVNFTEVKLEVKNNRTGLILMALMGTFGWYFLIKSFGLIDKTVAAPLNNLSSIFMVLLGIILLKEKDRLLTKLLAAGIVFVGAVMLGLA